MRHAHAPIKHSGDVHPPELDEGPDVFDDLGQPMAVATAPERSQPPAARPAAVATKPSLMPMMAMIAGGLLLLRLLR